jgi:hypothetical protein
MAKAPVPEGKAPARYESAQGTASQADLEATTRVVKEVQTTNRLVLIVLFALLIGIEATIVIFAVTTIISDTDSRNQLQVQVQVLNEQVKVLNSKLK